ncbi:uncharacterized protein METZ01_LOCUS290844 [marine metagenome]|uniref:Uncharacterized protein n=1 Tax=marine metagenome TaxID=408172 RepID=A0A382LMY2_9ZZZZ
MSVLDHFLQQDNDVTRMLLFDKGPLYFCQLLQRVNSSQHRSDLARFWISIKRDVV